jgi:5'(3')-deoxyribonucleotidase
VIVLTDCDGVLADFVARVCEGLRFRGFDRTPADFKHFELAASLNVDEMRAVGDVMTAPGFVTQIEWYEGARQFLRDLSQVGTVHAVTAPFHGSPSWMYERMQWFAGEVPSDRIHFVSGKYTMAPTRAPGARVTWLSPEHDWTTPSPKATA